MSKWHFSMSKAALLNRVDALKLEKGNILIAKDMETLKALEWLSSRGNFKLDFYVPIILCPQGLQVLTKEDVLNILEQLEQTDKSVLPEYHISEQPSAPL